MVKKIIMNLDLSKSRKGLQLKSTALSGFFLSLVKSLKNLEVYNGIEKCGFFSDFQYGMRSSRSTADHLTIVSDRIARAFNRSGATRAVALDISKDFDRVLYASLLPKFRSYGMSDQIFGLISSFLGNTRLRMVLDGKCLQEFQLMQEFLQAPFLVLHISYYTLMTFLTTLSVLLLSMLMILLPVLL